jgi:hypothetical protein
MFQIRILIWFNLIPHIQLWLLILEYIYLPVFNLHVHSVTMLAVCCAYISVFLMTGLVIVIGLMLTLLLISSVGLVTETINLAVPCKCPKSQIFDARCLVP